MTNKISITEIEPPATWTPIDFPYKNKDGIELKVIKNIYIHIFVMNVIILLTIDMILKKNIYIKKNIKKIF
jgi:hypothetical protein